MYDSSLGFRVSVTGLRLNRPRELAFSRHLHAVSPPRSGCSSLSAGRPVVDAMARPTPTWSSFGGGAAKTRRSSMRRKKPSTG